MGWASAMKYKIDKNIPMPEAHRPLAGNFPFADMEVGDSFVFSRAKPQTVGYLAAVFGRRQNPRMKFKIIKTAAGYRCWRIE